MVTYITYHLACRGLRAVQSRKVGGTSANVRSAECCTIVGRWPAGTRVLLLNQLQPPDTHALCPRSRCTLPSCHGSGVCITPCEVTRREHTLYTLKAVSATAVRVRPPARAPRHLILFT